MNFTSSPPYTSQRSAALADNIAVAYNCSRSHCRLGRAPRSSERFASQAAANTLRTIAESHGESFFRGHLAEQNVADSTKYGSILVVEEPDLSFGFGRAQLIHRLDGGGYVGGSDQRKEGGAYGY